MKERTTEKAFGFSYYGWDEGGGDFGDVQFYDVEFTEDFGSIKAGAKFDCVLVQHVKACLIAQRNDPETGALKEEIVVNWKAVPKSS